MSDDGSIASSYYSDDDETFEPLVLPKKKATTSHLLDEDGQPLDENDEGSEDEDEEEGSNDEDEDEEEEEDEEYRKITHTIKENLLERHYPEKKYQNYKEVEILSQVIRDKQGRIVDDHHKTFPILTKYERTRVLGERTRQIQQGSPLFIENPENIIDSYVLAEMELKQKKIPFIIQRPLPYGTSIEYWRLADLEIL